MVKDIYSGSSSSDPQELTVANSKLFFSAINAAGRELWLSNGTDAGTILVKNTDGAASSGITTANMIEYDNKLFFVAANAISGTEVWVSDGTTTGTEILKDINPVSASSYPGVMKVFNNKLYFAANDGTNGTELWVTDGTAAGTQLFVGLIPGSQHGNPQLTHTAEYTNLLFFTANHPTLSGTHLYCTDGTTTGTKLVSNPALTQSNPLLNGNYELYAYKNSLYFVSKYTSSGNELWWVTDTVKFTGITSTPPKSSFSIYPNPGDGNYTIELKEFDYTDKYITVYDILGKEVYKCPITNPKFQITLNQPKGIYIVKLQLDDAVLTKRVVVE
jgi:ELWxxDGT repeat protein